MRRRASWSRTIAYSVSNEHPRTGSGTVLAKALALSLLGRAAPSSWTACPAIAKPAISFAPSARPTAEGTSSRRRRRHREPGRDELSKDGLNLHPISPVENAPPFGMCAGLRVTPLVERMHVRLRDDHDRSDGP